MSTLTLEIHATNIGVKQPGDRPLTGTNSQVTPRDQNNLPCELQIAAFTFKNTY